MRPRIRLQWQCIKAQLSGEDRIVVRLSWDVRPGDLREVECLLLQVEDHARVDVRSAVIVAGPDGVEVPRLPGGSYLVPAPAIAVPLYLVIDLPRGVEAGLPLEALLVRPGEDDPGDRAETVVDLRHAWPRTPGELEREIVTLRRVASTGGKGSERRGYLRRAMEVLATPSHPATRDLANALATTQGAESLPGDLLPLSRAGAIFALARAAEDGDVDAVVQGIRELPPPLGDLPEVAELTEVARMARTDPATGHRHLIREGRAARAAGRTEDCLRVVEGIPPGSPVAQEAEQLRLEAIADAIEAALHAGRRAEARDWLVRESSRLEAAVGVDDPWLRSVRHAAGFRGTAVAYDEDLPYADVVEEEGFLALSGRALWKRMRRFLDR